MRVIAGKYKRSMLFEVESIKTRSTKDRVKETLFNMLGPLHGTLQGLDAFAGSGALGIEALSRGVNHLDFIEMMPDAVKVLNKNIVHLDLKDCAVYKSDTFTALTRLKKQYDLILLDPPYEITLLNKTLLLIAENSLLHGTGIVVSLSHKKDSIAIPSAFTVVKKRCVGITEITFFEWSE